MAGFLPVRSQSSAPWNDGADEFYVPATDTTPLAIGDPVVITGDSSPNGVPGVTRAASNGAVFGVVVGFRPSMSIVANGYRLASTEAWAIVEHNPDTLFEVTEDGIGGFLANTSTNLNVDFTVAAPAANRSSAVLDSSTAAVTATLPFRIVGRSMRVNNDLGTTSTVWNVKLNKTSDASGTAGV